MPEEPAVPSPKKRNERTEAKFLEDAGRVIAEAEREGADYKPPNAIAELRHLQPKRDEVIAKRTTNQAVSSALETGRNQRENLYKIVRSDVRSLIDYAVSYGIEKNEIDALKAIARDVGGRRAGKKKDNSISVAQLSYASIADNYSRFVEQYAALGIDTEEDFYKASTHRDKVAVLRAANDNVISLEAQADASGEALDKAAYTDADSLMKGCISAKSYIKSKYKGAGPFKNISKTTFILPRRLRG